MRLIATCLSLATIVAAAPAAAQAPAPRPRLTMERYDGPPVRTDLGFGIVLNSGSGLRREWFVLRDEAAPVFLEGPAGAAVAFKDGDRGASGRYEYRLALQLRAREPIPATEVKVHVFDVFGRLLRTLVSTELTDYATTSFGSAAWRISTEAEASQAYASVAYVASARTATGRVYEVDRAAVLEHLRKVARRITEADLDPK